MGDASSTFWAGSGTTGRRSVGGGGITTWPSETMSGVDGGMAAATCGAIVGDAAAAGLPPFTAASAVVGDWSSLSIAGNVTSFGCRSVAFAAAPAAAPLWAATSSPSGSAFAVCGAAERPLSARAPKVTQAPQSTTSATLTIRGVRGCSSVSWICSRLRTAPWSIIHWLLPPDRYAHLRGSAKFRTDFGGVAWTRPSTCAAFQRVSSSSRQGSLPWTMPPPVQ